MSTTVTPATTGTRSRRGLVALLAAETISRAGTRMSQLALPWLVLTTTGDAVITGLVGTAEIAPLVVLKVIGAPLVDRVGGRRVAVTGNLLAATAMLAVPVLAGAGLLTVPALLGLVFAAGLARGPAGNATTVMLPGVTTAAGTGIGRATGLFDGAGRTATLLGAPLGGVLIPLLGAANVVAIDAISFLAAALLVLLLVPHSAGVTTTAAEAPGGGYLTQLRDGLGYVVRHRLLRSIAGMVLFTNLADAAMSGVLLILWAQQRYGSTERLGIVIAVMGGAAVGGALLMTAWGNRLPRRWTFAVCFVIGGAPRFAVLAVPAPFWLVLVVWAVSGLAAGTINPVLGAAMYETVPRHLQARALSGVEGIGWAGIPFGTILAGALAGGIGLRTALIVGVVVYGLITLDPFLRRAWSTMDHSAAGDQVVCDAHRP